MGSNARFEFSLFLYRYRFSSDKPWMLGTISQGSLEFYRSSKFKIWKDLLMTGGTVEYSTGYQACMSSFAWCHCTASHPSHLLPPAPTRGNRPTPSSRRRSPSASVLLFFLFVCLFVFRNAVPVRPPATTGVTGCARHPTNDRRRLMVVVVVALVVWSFAYGGRWAGPRRGLQADVQVDAQDRPRHLDL